MSPLGKTLPPPPAPYPNIWSHAERMVQASDAQPARGDVSRMPSLNEIQRAVEAEESTPQSSVSHRSLGLPSHSSSNDSPQTPQHQQAQLQAQLALQHQAKLMARARSDKEKMLAGEPYHAHAKELVHDREQCKAALWRFNNSMNPNVGISRDERVRFFRDILYPRLPDGSTASVGDVLKNVEVEEPFNCNYGYNIRIGSDVHVGLNCTIMDACRVSIGSNTVIGPNVNIISATLPIQPRRRAGGRGLSLARPVTIEDDCFIGAGATIL